MQDKKQSLVPELRFPGFDGEWEMKRIEDSFQERVEKNRGDLPLLSLGEDGLMLQSESQRKDNSNSDKSKYLRVAVGDIAYNTMRMWQGRCVYCNIEGIVSPAYTVCKTKEGIDPLFHYYLFKTNQMISIFHQHSQGLVNDTLNLKYEAFSKIKYLLPSLPEQQKIAECLSSVDYLIQEETDQLQALKDHKKGLMQQLFPQDGETIPKRRFPGFEGEWEEKKLGDITNNNDSQRKPITKNQRKAGSYPYYGANGIQDFVEGFIFDGNYILVGEDGSVISENENPILNWVSGKIWVNNHAHVLSEKTHACLKYIYYALSVVKISGLVTGIPPKLNQENLNKIIIPIPTLPEQQKIAACLSSLDEEIAAQQQKVEALREHKKGLMQKLFPTIN